MNSKPDQPCTIPTSEALEGWVAIGFSQDQGMGDDAVVMATPRGILSRWNIEDPIWYSIVTEDFGVVGDIVQVNYFYLKSQKWETSTYLESHNIGHRRNALCGFRTSHNLWGGEPVWWLYHHRGPERGGAHLSQRLRETWPRRPTAQAQTCQIQWEFHFPLNCLSKLIKGKKWNMVYGSLHQSV